MNTIKVMLSWWAYLTSLYLGRFSPLSGQVILCPFFRKKLTTAFPANTQRHKNVGTTSLQRHDVVTTLLQRCVLAGFLESAEGRENNSWSTYTTECCRTWRGSNPRPPHHQSDPIRLSHRGRLSKTGQSRKQSPAVSSNKVLQRRKKKKKKTALGPPPYNWLGTRSPASKTGWSINSPTSTPTPAGVKYLGPSEQRHESSGCKINVTKPNLMRTYLNL